MAELFGKMAEELITGNIEGVSQMTREAFEVLVCPEFISD